jgi:hypothetical protein
MPLSPTAAQSGASDNDSFLNIPAPAQDYSTNGLASLMNQADPSNTEIDDKHFA